MAHKLKDFDFTHQSRLTIPGGKDPFPWDKWFDGDIWQIEHGKDFDSHPLMMERIIRTRIVGREGKVTMRHLGVNGEPWGIIVLRRSDIEGPETRKRREASEKRTEARAAKKMTAASKGSKVNGHTPAKRTPTKRVAALANA